MNAYEIIRKKREGGRLTEDEIKFFVGGYTRGDILEYQMSAFLMAVFFKGMDFSETTYLCNAMMNSGEILDLSSISGIKVDKHSTGGVGDKVSLILAPLVASCGVPVPMVSGRGLGHTGGTLDKLESIPGFRVRISREEFISILKRVGCAIMGQTDEMCPADKKMYSLRDVTATVESIPLISASIMSKKLAEGTDALVLDVKTGSGAFMKDKKDAIFLAKTMIEIGKRMRKKVVAFITDMSQPLGTSVGNALEVREVLGALKGDGSPDLMEVTYALGAEMLILGKRARNKNDAKKILKKSISEGKALAKFRDLIKAQGGNEKIVEDISILQKAKYEIPVFSEKSGYIQKMDCLEIGLSAVELGAGRKTLEDKIDHSVGFIFKKKLGGFVKRGEEIIKIYCNEERKGEVAKKALLTAIKIGSEKPKQVKLIYERIG